MSDLAPFVAAAIRDRVVSELQEENRRLRDDLNKAMTVTVTGQGGQPIYASSHFRNGRVEEDSAFWSVRFDENDNDDGENDDDNHDYASSTSNTLPLSRLGEMEIFVGGIMLCEMSQDYVEGFSSLDSITGGVRFLELEVRKCWITLEILEGSVSEEGLNRLRGASLGMLWRVLSGHVAATNPHACLRVQEVSFDTKYVPVLMARVPVDPHTEEAQRQLAQSQALLREIVTRLRRHYPNIRGSHTLLAQGRHLLESLRSRGIQNDADPRLDAALEALFLEDDRVRGLFVQTPQQQRQASNRNIFPVAR